MHRLVHRLSRVGVEEASRWATAQAVEDPLTRFAGPPPEGEQLWRDHFLHLRGSLHGSRMAKELDVEPLRPLWEKVGRASGSDEGSITLSDKALKIFRYGGATPHPSGFACHLLPQGAKESARWQRRWMTVVATPVASTPKAVAAGEPG
jgi:hypothetical protein